MNELDVSKLISAARQGGSEEKSQLVGHFRHYLRLLAHLHVKPLLKAKFDESDIVQETCIQAAQAFDQFCGDNEKQFAAWLRQIMANKGAEKARNFVTDKRDIKMEIRLQNEFNRSSIDLARMIPDRNSSPSHAAIQRERSVELADGSRSSRSKPAKPGHRGTPKNTRQESEHQGLVTTTNRRHKGINLTPVHCRFEPDHEWPVITRSMTLIAWNKSETLNPNNYKVYKERGLARLKAKQYRESLADLDLLVTVAATTYNVQLFLANCRQTSVLHRLGELMK